jgi:hypothetical protein
MASVTYYAVLPFVWNEDGELCPDEAIECHSPTAAAARARAVVAGRAGAVAFSRTGDPDIGEFADAVIITTAGEVPADLAAATGA